MRDRILPAWFGRSIPAKETIARMARVRDSGARTVCAEARCPNFGECLESGKLTFLILGPSCTRHCRFCSVDKAQTPAPVDPQEPGKICAVMARLGARYCVITSVTRDDLPDGGAGHFAAVIRAVRAGIPGAGIEVLLPDFAGCAASLETIAAQKPEVAGHNVETVPRLYRTLRPGAGYARSLEVLERLKVSGGPHLVKSSLMLGLGETAAEIENVMRDIRGTGCDILTLGQYLAPSPGHAAVREFVPPAEFERLRELGLAMGFRTVAAGPLVRSSYRAEEIYENSIAGSLRRDANA